MGIRFSRLANQFGKSKPFSEDMRQNTFNPFTIVDRAAIVFTVVVAERLFVKVTEQMEWLDTYIGSLDSAVQEAPEVFEVVAVEAPVQVGNRMAYNLVRVLCVQIAVGWQFIVEKSRPDSQKRLAESRTLLPKVEHHQNSSSGVILRSHER